MRKWSVGPGLGLLAVMSSCGTSQSPPVSKVLVSDSSGVAWVEVATLHGIAPQEWRLEEAFRTSKANVTLFRVSTALLLQSGTLVVANDGNQEVLLIAEDGRPVRAVGREGSGPGEFKAVTSLHESASGFLAYDARLARFTQFDSSGEALSTRSLRPPNAVVDLLPVLTSPEGPDLAVYGSQRIGKGAGIKQDTTPLLLYQGPDSEPDTLGHWGAREGNYTSFPTGGWARGPVGFGRHLAASGRSGRVVLGTTDSLNATVLDAGGRVVMRLVGRFTGAAVSRSDGEAWKADYVSSISEDAPKQLREAFQAAPYHDTYPAFDAAAVDSDGNVWIGSAAEWNDTERSWAVFAANGQPIGAVTLPKDVDVLDVAYGRIVGRVRDRQGVEDVVVYRIANRR